jgi:hypothetical protein
MCVVCMHGRSTRGNQSELNKGSIPDLVPTLFPLSSVSSLVTLSDLNSFTQVKPLCEP